MLSETFDITYKDTEYKVQRYCPHALGDLSKGEIKDGHVVCPLHGWEFNIKTGQCKNKKKYCIKTENVNEKECLEVFDKTDDFISQLENKYTI